MSKRPGSSLSIPKGGRKKKGIDSSRGLLWQGKGKWFQREFAYKENVFYSESSDTLPREEVDTPSLEAFKVWLERALSNLI